MSGRCKPYLLCVADTLIRYTNSRSMWNSHAPEHAQNFVERATQILSASLNRLQKLLQIFSSHTRKRSCDRTLLLSRQSLVTRTYQVGGSLAHESPTWCVGRFSKERRNNTQSTKTQPQPGSATPSLNSNMYRLRFFGLNSFYQTVISKGTREPP